MTTIHFGDSDSLLMSDGFMTTTLVFDIWRLYDDNFITLSDDYLMAAFL